MTPGFYLSERGSPGGAARTQAQILFLYSRPLSSPGKVLERLAVLQDCRRTLGLHSPFQLQFQALSLCLLGMSVPRQPLSRVPSLLRP